MNVTALIFAVAFAAVEQPVPCDIVVRGATIYDGTDQPGRLGDVAIRGDRIAAVGSFETSGSPRQIDATGLIVAPGFIDLHTHCDNSGIETAERRELLNYLTQGVTTVVTGNCGSGPLDVAAYLQSLDKGRIGCNVLHLAPHNTIREKVMGNVNRPVAEEELHAMKRMVDQAMRDGAWGISTGLEYTPGTYAETTELIELSKVVARHGGIYASHMRNEDGGLLASIEEVIRIGQQAQLPVHISHLKAGSRIVWGKSTDAAALIQQARDRGQTVTADQYPYRGWSTGLSAALVPGKFRQGTDEEYRARLDDPAQNEAIRRSINEAIGNYSAESTFAIASCDSHPNWQGKTLGAIAAEEHKPVIEIVLQIERDGGATVVGLTMNEQDVRVIMQQPFVATASDGQAAIPSETVPHPRSYGTFSRTIGRYALDEKVITLEHALRAATGLPADIIGLKDRGYLRPDSIADVVVFDPKTFRDRATFEDPHQYSDGVRYLFVNGAVAIDDGEATGALAGRALRHASADDRSASRQRADVAQDLTSPHAELREEALEQLIHSRRNSSLLQQHVVRLLDDPDAAVAGKAVTALSMYGCEAFAELTRIFQHGTAQQRWGATIALSKMDCEIDPFLPQLTEQLTDEADDLLVRASLAAMARMGNKAAPAIPALRSLLRHKDAELRWGALSVCSSIGPAAHPLLPDLTRCLQDDALEVRLAATAAIRQIQPPQPTTPEKLTANLHWLDQRIPARLQELHVPGVSIAIIHQGQVSWARGFGVRDVRDRQPVTTETIFEACSMSKPIMGLCVLQLLQKDQLDLDKPLVDYLGHDYLPDQPEHRQITARMALTHRTGLPNWRKGYDEMGGPIPVLFPPGSTVGYSGEGILFLQRALEAITQQPLNKYAQEELFEPLGLTRTSFVWNEVVEKDLASGHAADGNFKSKTKYRKANGAYSLYTTPTEYARLMLTLITPSILRDRAFTPESIDLLLRRHHMIDGDQPMTRPGLAQAVASYRALAWTIEVSPDGDFVQHSGSNSSGFKSFGQFNRQKQSGIVICCNGDNGSILRDEIVAQMGDL